MRRNGEQADRVAAFNARFDRLRRASLTIHAVRSPNAVAGAVTDAARELVGAHVARGAFAVAVGGPVTLHALSVSERFAAQESGDAASAAWDVSAMTAALRRPRRLTAAELEAHPRWRRGAGAAARTCTPRSVLVAPLLSGAGRNVGGVALSEKYEGEFTADDETMVAHLSDVAVLALENAWHAERARARHEQLQALARTLLADHEDERLHLARELHDELGQLLTGLRFLVKPGGPVDETAHQLEEARTIIDELIARVRGLSIDLRPVALEELGLVPALLALIERFTEQTGLVVTFEHAGMDGRGTRAAETAAYRLVQEALTNVARHAGVGAAQVRVQAAANRLNVEIEDHGRGFDADADRSVATGTGAHGGLAGMRERVRLTHGHVTIESSPGAGTRITADLPWHATERR